MTARRTILNPFSGPDHPLEWNLSWVDGGDAVEIYAATTTRDASARGAGKVCPVWGQRWPGKGVRLDAGKLLGFLADSWASLAADFKLPRSATVGVVDFRTGLGQPDLPPFQISFDGPRWTIQAAQGTCRLGSETLMAIESLAVLGDQLAAGLPEGCDAVKSWQAMRATDDLPPLAPDIWGEEPPVDLGFETSVAAFYARKLGISVESYIDVAIFEAAAHDIWCGNQCRGVEPLPWDGFSALVMGSLPGREELEKLAALGRAARVTMMGSLAAGEAMGVAEAVRSMNVDMRGEYFYADWPRRSISLPEIPSGIAPADLLGSKVAPEILEG